MSIDNSNPHQKAYCRNIALSYVTNFNSMWDVCCGKTGMMYEMVYKHKFQSGIAIDKIAIPKFNRPNWVFMRGDAMDLIPEIQPVAEFVDIDPYGTCLPFLERIMPLIQTKMVIAFHDFAQIKNYHFQRAIQRYSPFGFLSLQWYIEKGQRQVIESMSSKFNLRVSDYEVFADNVNVNGYVVLETVC